MPRCGGLIDRRIYLPRSLANDRARCSAAGAQPGVQFATKPELALEMITGAVMAKMPAAWVASDGAYGDNGAFRAGVAKLGLGYGLVVSRTTASRPTKRQVAAARRSHRRRLARGC